MGRIYIPVFENLSLKFGNLQSQALKNMCFLLAFVARPNSELLNAFSNAKQYQKLVHLGHFIF